MLTHKDYPPFISLVQLLWGKLSGGVTESSSSLAIHLFTGVLLCASIRMATAPTEVESGKKRVIGNLIMGMIMGFISMAFVRIFDSFGIFNTIYTDLYISAFAIYVFTFIFVTKTDDSVNSFIALILLNASMLISKQIGIFFVGISLIFYLFISGFPTRKKIIRTLINAVFSGFNIAMWKIYLRPYNISGQFDLNSINIRALFRDIIDTSSMRFAATRHFIKNLYDVPLSVGVVELTFFFALIIVVAFGALLYRLSRGVYGSYQINYINIVLLTGSLAYAGVLWVLYMFCFSEGEMVALASFDRYMSSYWLFAFGFLGVLLLGVKRFSLHRALAIAALLIIIAGPMNLSCLKPQILRGEPNSEYRNRAESIDQAVAPGNTVFMLSCNCFLDMMYTQYYLDDVYYDFHDEYHELGDLDGDDPIWGSIAGYINNCDYVSVYDVSDEMKEVFQGYVDGGELKAYSLYKINNTEDGFTLSLSSEI